MARPPLPLGTAGRARRTTVDGKPAAVAYYRDFDGKTRKMQRQGRTGAEAERILAEAIRDRLTPTVEYLNRDSRLSSLADAWIEEIERSNRKSATVTRYQSCMRAHVSPIGELRIREATVPLLQRLIDRVADGSGDAQARMLGVVLTGMLSLAVRHGAALTNAADDLLLPPEIQKEVRAPSVDEIHELRAALKAYDAVPGRRADAIHDLADFCDMLTATGARPNEILALDWPDIDFTEGKVRLTATLTGVPGTGLVRQESTKSDSSDRRLVLPRYALDMLARRRVMAYCEHVFPSANGTYRWLENVRVQWARALVGSGVEWITPKACRKAVATALEAIDGIEAAKDQLGHKSSRTTSKSYVPARIDRPDRSSVLEIFGENSG